MARVITLVVFEGTLLGSRLLGVRRGEVGLWCRVVRKDKGLFCWWWCCRDMIVVVANAATARRRVLLLVKLLLWRRKRGVLVGGGIGGGIGGEWGLVAKDLLLGIVVPLGFCRVYLFLFH